MGIEKVKCSTPDFAEENVAKLIKLFPEVEGEKGTVDLDKLRQVLSSKVIEGNVERYEFTWPGKRAAKAAASAATTKTLRPCREESVNFDTTENLYIEGDNLEVLKLLQTSYAGKVKVIYIDPPYNTGHDFVYRDKFSLTQKELEDEAGSFDEDGNRFEVNDSAEARYHSNWCSMMYPRLKLARNLLRDDGVLFMSIDDNEVVNARKLCDEVFGEVQFVAQFVWEKRVNRENRKETSVRHDYILCYVRSRNGDEICLYQLPMNEKALANYSNPDNDPRGPWKSDPAHAQGGHGTKSQFYTLTAPNGKRHELPSGRCWLYTQTVMEEAIRDGRIWFGMDGNGVPRIKTYLNVKERGLTPETMLFAQDASTNEKAKNDLKELFDGISVFDTPKPIELVKMLAQVSIREGIVVDFFSGSAVTAHAVMQLNAEDGGNRKFIMVQLPEPCAEDSEAAKAGYKNICEIGKERIRRAGKKISEELRAKSEELKKKAEKNGPSLFDEQSIEQSEQSNNRTIPDIGFRVLKLDSSSLNDTSATVSETDQKFANFDRIKEGRSSEDLLFQMLLETHIPLSDKIEKKTVGGNEVFFVSGTALVACLDAKAKMTTDFFIAVAKLKPGIAFFRDDAFADDSARTNLQQAFDQFSPSTAIKVI